MGFLVSPMHLVEYTRVDGTPIVKDRRVLMQLERPLTYVTGAAGNGEWITVPDTFVTDLASVPRLFWTLFPPDGKWMKAAVLHDYLCETKGIGGKYPSKQVHKIFREAMESQGVNRFDRTCIYTAVATFGPRW